MDQLINRRTLVTLRSTPNLINWRPADLVETAVAWKEAVTSSSTPTCLIFSRQGLQQFKEIQSNSQTFIMEVIY